MKIHKLLHKLSITDIKNNKQSVPYLEVNVLCNYTYRRSKRMTYRFNAFIVHSASVLVHVFTKIHTERKQATYEF